jgi:hypothetical protein
MLKASIIALATTMGAGSFSPAAAVTFPRIPVPQYSDVEQVQYRRPPQRGYYHGYHGYHEQRRGYRRHSDGYWYPLAAFGAAAIISGSIANQAHSGSHAQRCADRYRSYRASDDSYQPSRGPRQACNL